MEFARRLWMSQQKISLLRRSASYRLVALGAHGKTSLTQLHHNLISRRAQVSALPSRFCSTCRNNNLPRCGLTSRSPQTFSAPRNLDPCAKNIHTSARLNVLLPPHLWILLKPIQKLFAIILGRSIRKWWRALPANKRQLFKESLRRNRWKLSLSAVGVGFLVILFYFTSLEEAPITGRMRLLVFRKENLDLLTAAMYESMIEELKEKLIAEKDERYQLVQRLVRYLMSCNPELANIDWTLHVVDQPIINAFALPNGQLFVFSGMLDAVADVDQLAFILCHEMAHVILDHAAEKASVSHLLDFLFMISLVAIWAMCPMDSLAVVGHWIQSKLQEFMFERPYSRTLETEADNVGLELAAKACFDVRASSVFWKQMMVMENLETEPSVPQWLSTHPSHENRAEHLDRMIPKALKLRESCKCPPLNSGDPRLVFERSKKLLLRSSREPKDRAIKGDLHPACTNDASPISAAVKAA